MTALTCRILCIIVGACILIKYWSATLFVKFIKQEALLNGAKKVLLKESDLLATYAEIKKLIDAFGIWSCKSEYRV